MTTTSTLHTITTQYCRNRYPADQTLAVTP